MAKNYERPELHTMDALSFETVCAGSGTFQCPGNYSGVHTESTTCHNCFIQNVPGFTYTQEWGVGTAVKQYMANGNACPAGFQSFGA